ncbi:MAG TPA: C-GCAxxG-C-C family protein [Syntrophorhabdaceae bacterium]|jgi:C_GCAxxG_C_C family probable redox protein
MDRIDRALQTFREGFNCSQAIARAFGPSYGLEEDEALGIAAAFGGGIARTGGTCGAVTGAMMIIGLAYGKRRADDKESVERTNRLAAAFLDRFARRHYTVTCRELLGCDMSTPEGLLFAKTHDLREQLCAAFIKDAAGILEELLSGEGESTPGNDPACT